MSKKTVPAEIQHFEFKVVMIGAVSVGKTAITNRLQFQIFDDDYQPTVGAGYIPYKTKHGANEVELQIWDTAGMERYKSLGSIYYRDSSAAIIVFDQTSQETADAITKWLDNFRMTVKNPCTIFIAANKDDLPNKEVKIDQVKKWCDTQRFGFFITSAKTGEGVQEMFDVLVDTLVSNHPYNNAAASPNLNLRKVSNEKKCC